LILVPVNLNYLIKHFFLNRKDMLNRKGIIPPEEEKIMTENQEVVIGIKLFYT